MSSTTRLTFLEERPILPQRRNKSQIDPSGNGDNDVEDRSEWFDLSPAAAQKNNQNMNLKKTKSKKQKKCESPESQSSSDSDGQNPLLPANAGKGVHIIDSEFQIQNSQTQSYDYQRSQSQQSYLSQSLNSMSSQEQDLKKYDFPGYSQLGKFQGVESSDLNRHLTIDLNSNGNDLSPTVRDTRTGKVLHQTTTQGQNQALNPNPNPVIPNKIQTLNQPDINPNRHSLTRQKRNKKKQKSQNLSTTKDFISSALRAAEDLEVGSSKESIIVSDKKTLKSESDSGSKSKLSQSESEEDNDSNKSYSQNEFDSESDPESDNENNQNLDTLKGNVTLIQVTDDNVNDLSSDLAAGALTSPGRAEQQDESISPVHRNNSTSVSVLKATVAATATNGKQTSQSQSASSEFQSTTTASASSTFKVDNTSSSSASSSGVPTSQQQDFLIQFDNQINTKSEQVTESHFDNTHQMNEVDRFIQETLAQQDIGKPPLGSNNPVMPTSSANCLKLESPTIEEILNIKPNTILNDDISFTNMSAIMQRSNPGPNHSVNENLNNSLLNFSMINDSQMTEGTRERLKIENLNLQSEVDQLKSEVEKLRQMSSSVSMSSELDLNNSFAGNTKLGHDTESVQFEFQQETQSDSQHLRDQLYPPKTPTDQNNRDGDVISKPVQDDHDNIIPATNDNVPLFTNTKLSDLINSSPEFSHTYQTNDAAGNSTRQAVESLYRQNLNSKSCQSYYQSNTLWNNRSVNTVNNNRSVNTLTHASLGSLYDDGNLNYNSRTIQDSIPSQSQSQNYSTNSKSKSESDNSLPLPSSETVVHDRPLNDNYQDHGNSNSEESDVKTNPIIILISTSTSPQSRPISVDEKGLFGDNHNHVLGRDNQIIDGKPEPEGRDTNSNIRLSSLSPPDIDNPNSNNFLKLLNLDSSSPLQGPGPGSSNIKSSPLVPFLYAKETYSAASEAEQNSQSQSQSQSLSLLGDKNITKEDLKKRYELQQHQSETVQQNDSVDSQSHSQSQGHDNSLSDESSYRFKHHKKNSSQNIKKTSKDDNSKLESESESIIKDSHIKFDRSSSQSISKESNPNSMILNLNNSTTNSLESTPILLHGSVKEKAQGFEALAQLSAQVRRSSQNSMGSQQSGNHSLMDQSSPYHSIMKQHEEQSKQQRDSEQYQVQLNRDSLSSKSSVKHASIVVNELESDLTKDNDSKTRSSGPGSVKHISFSTSGDAVREISTNSTSIPIKKQSHDKFDNDAYAFADFSFDKSDDEENEEKKKSSQKNQQKLNVDQKRKFFGKQGTADFDWRLQKKMEKKRDGSKDSNAISEDEHQDLDDKVNDDKKTSTDSPQIKNKSESDQQSKQSKYYHLTIGRDSESVSRVLAPNSTVLRNSKSSESSPGYKSISMENIQKSQQQRILSKDQQIQQQQQKFLRMGHGAPISPNQKITTKNLGLHNSDSTEDLKKILERGKVSAKNIKKQYSRSSDSLDNNNHSSTQDLIKSQSQESDESLNKLNSQNLDVLIQNQQQDSITNESSHTVTNTQTNEIKSKQSQQSINSQLSKSLSEIESQYSQSELEAIQSHIEEGKKIYQAEHKQQNKNKNTDLNKNNLNINDYYDPDSDPSPGTPTQRNKKKMMMMSSAIQLEMSGKDGSRRDRIENEILAMAGLSGNTLSSTGLQKNEISGQIQSDTSNNLDLPFKFNSESDTKTTNPENVTIKNAVNTEGQQQLNSLNFGSIYTQSPGYKSYVSGLQLQKDVTESEDQSTVTAQPQEAQAQQTKFKLKRAGGGGGNTTESQDTNTNSNNAFSPGPLPAILTKGPRPSADDNRLSEVRDSDLRGSSSVDSNSINLNQGPATATTAQSLPAILTKETLDDQNDRVSQVRESDLRVSGDVPIQDNTTLSESDTKKVQDDSKSDSSRFNFLKRNNDEQDTVTGPTGNLAQPLPAIITTQTDPNDRISQVRESDLRVSQDEPNTDSVPQNSTDKKTFQNQTESENGKFNFLKRPDINDNDQTGTVSSASAAQSLPAIITTQTDPTDRISQVRESDLRVSSVTEPTVTSIQAGKSDGSISANQSFTSPRLQKIHQKLNATSSNTQDHDSNTNSLEKAKNLIGAADSYIEDNENNANVKSTEIKKPKFDYMDPFQARWESFVTSGNKLGVTKLNSGEKTESMSERILRLVQEQSQQSQRAKPTDQSRDKSDSQQLQQKIEACSITSNKNNDLNLQSESNDNKTKDQPLPEVGYTRDFSEYYSAVIDQKKQELQQKTAKLLADELDPNTALITTNKLLLDKKSQEDLSILKKHANPIDQTVPVTLNSPREIKARTVGLESETMKSQSNNLNLPDYMKPDHNINDDIPATSKNLQSSTKPILNLSNLDLKSDSPNKTLIDSLVDPILEKSEISQGGAKSTSNFYDIAGVYGFQYAAKIGQEITMGKTVRNKSRELFTGPGDKSQQSSTSPRPLYQQSQKKVFPFAILSPAVSSKDTVIAAEQTPRPLGFSSDSKNSYEKNQENFRTYLRGNWNHANVKSQSQTENESDATKVKPTVTPTSNTRNTHRENINHFNNTCGSTDYYADLLKNKTGTSTNINSPDMGNGTTKSKASSQSFTFNKTLKLPISLEEQSYYDISGCTVTPGAQLTQTPNRYHTALDSVFGWKSGGGGANSKSSTQRIDIGGCRTEDDGNRINLIGERSAPGPTRQPNILQQTPLFDPPERIVISNVVNNDYDTTVGGNSNTVTNKFNNISRSIPQTPSQNQYTTSLLDDISNRRQAKVSSILRSKSVNDVHAKPNSSLLIGNNINSSTNKSTVPAQIRDGCLRDSPRGIVNELTDSLSRSHSNVPRLYNRDIDNYISKPIPNQNNQNQYHKNNNNDSEILLNVSTNTNSSFNHSAAPRPSYHAATPVKALKPQGQQTFLKSDYSRLSRSYNLERYDKDFVLKGGHPNLSNDIEEIDKKYEKAKDRVQLIEDKVRALRAMGNRGISRVGEEGSTSVGSLSCIPSGYRYKNQLQDQMSNYNQYYSPILTLPDGIYNGKLFDHMLNEKCQQRSNSTGPTQSQQRQNNHYPSPHPLNYYSSLSRFNQSSDITIEKPLIFSPRLDPPGVRWLPKSKLQHSLDNPSPNKIKMKQADPLSTSHLVRPAANSLYIQQNTGPPVTLDSQKESSQQSKLNKILSMDAAFEKVDAMSQKYYSPNKYGSTAGSSFKAPGPARRPFMFYPENDDSITSDVNDQQSQSQIEMSMNQNQNNENSANSHSVTSIPMQLQHSVSKSKSQGSQKNINGYSSPSDPSGSPQQSPLGANTGLSIDRANSSSGGQKGGQGVHVAPVYIEKKLPKLNIQNQNQNLSNLNQNQNPNKTMILEYRPPSGQTNAGNNLYNANGNYPTKMDFLNNQMDKNLNSGDVSRSNLRSPQQNQQNLQSPASQSGHRIYNHSRSPKQLQVKSPINKTQISPRLKAEYHHEHHHPLFKRVNQAANIKNNIELAKAQAARAKLRDYYSMSQYQTNIGSVLRRDSPVEKGQIQAAVDVCVNPVISGLGHHNHKVINSSSSNGRKGQDDENNLNNNDIKDQLSSIDTATGTTLVNPSIVWYGLPKTGLISPRNQNHNVDQPQGVNRSAPLFASDGGYGPTSAPSPNSRDFSNRLRSWSPRSPQFVDKQWSAAQIQMQEKKLQQQSKTPLTLPLRDTYQQQSSPNSNIRPLSRTPGAGQGKINNHFTFIGAHGAYSGFDTVKDSYGKLEKTGSRAGSPSPFSSKNNKNQYCMTGTPGPYNLGQNLSQQPFQQPEVEVINAIEKRGQNGKNTSNQIGQRLGSMNYPTTVNSTVIKSPSWTGSIRLAPGASRYFNESNQQSNDINVMNIGTVNASQSKNSLSSKISNYNSNGSPNTVTNRSKSSPTRIERLLTPLTSSAAQNQNQNQNPALKDPNSYQYISRKMQINYKKHQESITEQDRKWKGIGGYLNSNTESSFPINYNQDLRESFPAAFSKKSNHNDHHRDRQPVDGMSLTDKISHYGVQLTATGGKLVPDFLSPQKTKMNLRSKSNGIGNYNVNELEYYDIDQIHNKDYNELRSVQGQNKFVLQQNLKHGSPKTREQLMEQAQSILQQGLASKQSYNDNYLKVYVNQNQKEDEVQVRNLKEEGLDQIKVNDNADGIIDEKEELPQSEEPNSTVTDNDRNIDHIVLASKIARGEIPQELSPSTAIRNLEFNNNVKNLKKNLKKERSLGSLLDVVDLSHTKKYREEVLGQMGVGNNIINSEIENEQFKRVFKSDNINYDVNKFNTSDYQYSQYSRSPVKSNIDSNYPVDTTLEANSLLNKLSRSATPAPQEKFQIHKQNNINNFFQPLKAITKSTNALESVASDLQLEGPSMLEKRTEAIENRFKNSNMISSNNMLSAVEMKMDSLANRIGSIVSKEAATRFENDRVRIGLSDAASAGTSNVPVSCDINTTLLTNKANLNTSGSDYTGSNLNYKPPGPPDMNLLTIPNLISSSDPDMTTASAFLKNSKFLKSPNFLSHNSLPYMQQFTSPRSLSFNVQKQRQKESLEEVIKKIEVIGESAMKGESIPKYTDIIPSTVMKSKSTSDLSSVPKNASSALTMNEFDIKLSLIPNTYKDTMMSKVTSTYGNGNDMNGPNENSSSTAAAAAPAVIISTPNNKSSQNATQQQQSQSKYIDLINNESLTIPHLVPTVDLMKMQQQEHNDNQTFDLLTISRPKKPDFSPLIIANPAKGCSPTSMGDYGSPGKQIMGDYGSPGK